MNALYYGDPHALLEHLKNQSVDLIYIVPRSTQQNYSALLPAKDRSTAV